MEFVFGRDFAADEITGSDAANTLFGLGGNDKLDGGGGNDTLWGLTGRDMLTGGSGNDTFSFQNGNSGVGAGNRDQILDFTQGEDLIDLSIYGGLDGVAWYGLGPFNGGQPEARYVDTGPDIVIEIDFNGDLVVDEEIELTGSNVVLNPSGTDFILGP